MKSLPITSLYHLNMPMLTVESDKPLELWEESPRVLLKCTSFHKTHFMTMLNIILQQ